MANFKTNGSITATGEITGGSHILSHKADVDASNLSAANVTSWKDKLGLGQAVLLSGASGSISSGTKTLLASLSNFTGLVICIAQSGVSPMEIFGAYYPMSLINELYNEKYGVTGWSGGTFGMIKKISNTSINFMCSTNLQYYAIYGIK